MEVYTGCKVTDIDEHGISYQPGDAGKQPVQRLEARTVFWAAGVAGSPLRHSLVETAGARLERAGRIEVEPELPIPGHPEISVVGDLACARSHGDGDPQPVSGVGPAAKQMSQTAPTTCSGDSPAIRRCPFAIGTSAPWPPSAARQQSCSSRHRCWTP